jgi:hypothetical protein
VKRWLKKAKAFLQANYQLLQDWYLERDRLRQIRRREELGDL